MLSISFIVGNLCSVFGMAADSFSASRKTAKGVLLFQSLGQFFYVIGSVALKGYSAAVQSVVAIMRNFAAIKNINSRPVEWTLTALGVVFGLAFNNLGIMGLIPVISNLQYTIVIFKFKNSERILKISFMVNVAMFVIFNGVISNYVGVVSNSIVLITTAASLIKK